MQGPGNQAEKIGAIVALKSPTTAKSRLRPFLSDVDRRALYFFMARRVLGALEATPQIGAVWVVTASGEVARFAAGMGAAVIHQRDDRGTAAAFAHAIAALRKEGLRARILMIAGDLPLITASDLMPLVNRQTAIPSILIVPDRKRVGTNALLCSPPDVIEPCFGGNSFQAHLSAARLNRIPIHVIESQALSLDIDVADDLEVLRTYRGFTADAMRGDGADAA